MATFLISPKTALLCADVRRKKSIHTCLIPFLPSLLLLATPTDTNDPSQAGPKDQVYTSSRGQVTVCEELRAPTVEKAAGYLDAVIAALAANRTCANVSSSNGPTNENSYRTVSGQKVNTAGAGLVEDGSWSTDTTV
ncbi:unnamed protein product [Protopolystoma xenopodis]|uniref:Uncharacterized protein n=1 Tax=Protopolystoma xenopodis TaxID=117903 RepID=A0A448WJ43_9PLAT|nr:unnamed protein product [Protopolystoma xenopodis]